MPMQHFMFRLDSIFCLKVCVWISLGGIFSGCSYDNPNLPYRYDSVVADTANTTVLHVTNLNSDGPGSLRHAMEYSAPRTIVFKVGGVIDLEEKSIKVKQPYLRVMGETAPSPGITLIRGGIRLETHDIHLSHLMVRPGDAGKTREDDWKPDGITVYGAQARRIVIDHCSVTWAVDENIAVSGPDDKGPSGTAGSVVIKNSIIAEALNNSTHPEGPHSKGILVHDNVRNVSLVDNLLAHNMRRNPYFKSNTTGIIKGNVIYNPGMRAIHFSSSSKKRASPHNTVVSNLLLYGKSTRDGLDLISKHGKIYSEDNHVLGGDGTTSDGDAEITNTPPVINEGIDLEKSNILKQFCITINNAGARPWDPSTIDVRIKKDVVNRTGRIIDSQNDVGGYPKNLIPNTSSNISGPPENPPDIKSICMGSLSVIEKRYSAPVE